MRVYSHTPIFLTPSLHPSKRPMKRVNDSQNPMPSGPHLRPVLKLQNSPAIARSPALSHIALPHVVRMPVKTTQIATGDLMTTKADCLVVQLATTPASDVIKILVAFEAAALNCFTRAHSRSASSTVSPASRTTPSTARALSVVAPTSLVLASIVRTSAVLVSAGTARPSTTNRTGTTTLVSSRIPARSLHRVVTCK